MKIRTPNSCCTDNIWFFGYFYGFLGFVVLEISWHFGGVYQIRYCASDGAFFFSFVYVMYLNIASYLCWKQIKSKLGNTMCLWMIFYLCTLDTARSQWVLYQGPSGLRISYVTKISAFPINLDIYIICWRIAESLVQTVNECHWRLAVTVYFVANVVWEHYIFSLWILL